VEYQQIAAAGSFPVLSTDVLSRVFWNGAGGVRVVSCLAHCWVLRQQDRGCCGFGRGVFRDLCVSGFLAPPIMHVCVWGVVYGVVV
jgi:hypothetical protein